MSGGSGGTPNLGSFNKDKVANKFGIQLKTKDPPKQSSNELTPGTSTVTKNKTVSDFRVQNDSNGFKTNHNQHSTSSTTSQLTKNSLENLIKSKSSIGLTSTSRDVDERRTSLTSNVNHSTSLKPVKSTPSNESLSKSSSSSNILVNAETVKRSSLSPEPVSTRRTSITKTIELPISPGSSSIRRLSITTITDRPASPEVSSVKRPSQSSEAISVSPTPSIQRQSISPTPLTTRSKTEAQIEHQKDQPLYKRQLSKTLDNATSTTTKNKHIHEPILPLTTISKR